MKPIYFQLAALFAPFVSFTQNRPLIEAYSDNYNAFQHPAFMAMDDNLDVFIVSNSFYHEKESLTPSSPLHSYFITYKQFNKQTKNEKNSIVFNAICYAGRHGLHAQNNHEPINGSSELFENLSNDQIISGIDAPDQTYWSVEDVPTANPTRLATYGRGLLDFYMETPAQENLVYDFESGNLTGWTTTGNAFSVGDVTDAIVYWGDRPFKQQGTYHMWGFNEGGDGGTGEMRTENFTLGGDGQIAFKIGGGAIYNELYIALYDASTNQELMRETGVNDEAYQNKAFDASSYIGTGCYIKLVDNATGGWGHLMENPLKVSS